MAEFNINDLQNSKLRIKAKLVDIMSKDPNTRGNGKIDGDEVSVFLKSASKILQEDESAAEEVEAILQGKKYNKADSKETQNEDENKVAKAVVLHQILKHLVVPKLK